MHTEGSQDWTPLPVERQPPVHVISCAASGSLVGRVLLRLVPL